MSIRGILPNVLNLRGPLLRSPGSGGTTAVSTSPSTVGRTSHDAPIMHAILNKGVKMNERRTVKKIPLNLVKR